MLAPWEYSVWFQSFLSTDDGSAASPSTALLASLFSEVTCWNVAVIGTMAGSLFFILLSNSFMQNHPAAVTSAFPSAKVVASESQRRINPRSSCSLPNTPVPSVRSPKIASPFQHKSPPTPPRLRALRSVVTCPRSRCPPISHISGNVSFFGERFCNATIPRSVPKSRAVVFSYFIWREQW